LGRPPLKKVFLQSIFLISFYLFIPFLLRSVHVLPLRFLLVFYFLNSVFLFLLLRNYFNKKNQVAMQIQDFQEKINIITDQNIQEAKSKKSFSEKIFRYSELKKIIEQINKKLDLDFIAESLCQIAFSLVAHEKGCCILYLVDSQTHTLRVFKAKKEDKKLVVKAKEGDIFDSWVLRHVSPLLVEDIRKDFRFDLDKLSEQDTRLISSLISSPFVSENRFMGILRLDNPRPGVFSQDDLRFLVTICDLGAVALENSELFQKTQDLAIHDGLTALYTKGFFIDRLNEEFKRTVRRNSALSLFMIDIDYFKKYNDQFGHTAGDIVLKNLSSLLVDALKDYTPLISRFGGEEFCVILPGLEKEKAVAIAREIRQKVEKAKIVLRRQETNITVSIGVSGYPQDAGEAEELIIKADRAMYEAKAQGRNKVVVA